MISVTISRTAGRTQAVAFTNRSTICMVFDQQGTNWVPLYGINPQTRSIVPLPSCFEPDAKVIEAIKAKAVNR